MAAILQLAPSKTPVRPSTDCLSPSPFQSFSQNPGRSIFFPKTSAFKSQVVNSIQCAREDSATFVDKEANSSVERPWKTSDARLVLEDGSIWRAKSFGASGTQVGEVVFNTSLTGYQEILTDPSYAGQFVLMTNPHIGNTGVNPDDEESNRCFLAGLVIKRSSICTSNWRCTETLGDYLAKRNIMGIYDVDTRAITRRLRQDGSLIGVLSTEKSQADEQLLEMARNWKIVGVDLISGVSCTAPYEWSGSTDSEWEFNNNQNHGETFHVIAYDFGIKHNILRRLASYGCKITVVPATWPAVETLKMRPDGVLFSNGPGDPAAVPYAVQTVKDIIGKVPVFGICMGHQLLGQALGGKTFKMKFGHHGGNHPVCNLRNGCVEISAQNHNYAVDPTSLPPDVEVTHVNLNDNSCAGLAYPKLNLISLQYHPESSPGPHDSCCGHPSFQIRCSTPHSVITINSIPFHLLSLSHPFPTTLTLTPSLPPPGPHQCPSLPPLPINLSSSPFRLSSDPCPLLLSLPRLCPHQIQTIPSVCNLTPWQLNLLAEPFRLFPTCPSNTRLLFQNHTTSCTQNKNNVSQLMYNFLKSGFQVEWDLRADPYSASCSSCRKTDNGSCGFNDTDSSKPFLCFPNLHRLNRHSHSSSKKLLVLLIGGLFVAPCVFLLLLVSLWVVRRRWITRRGDPVTMFMFLHRHQLHPPVYTYDQLRVSTNGFDPRRKIGDGGFGSVYLAQLDDGWIAAVKRLHRQHPAATTKSFCNEILILSSLRHPNLVRLHGYCCDPRGLLLVYDYVPNGTLADHLHGSRSLYRKASLTWQVRVDVALQTASALEYLHFSLKPPVVHRDITSNNIFVERDMRIKVGDFGLSRLLSLPDPNSSAAAGSSSEYVCCTGPQGTPGYLDPEYHRSFRLTEKSDVYSFGVVLLELVTGMKAVDLRRDKREVSLADLVVSKIQVGALHEVLDPVLVRQGEGTGTIEAVAELAFRCVAGEKDDRPNARELVEELKRIRGQVQDVASKGS